MDSKIIDILSYHYPNSEVGLNVVSADIIAALTPQWSDEVPTSRNDPYMRKVYDKKWMMHNDGQPTLTAKVKGQWAKATPPESKGE